ncbi:MAG TPA: restriction endonuclease subunit S, partial [Terriglobales bacterium]|nr:restriction endonuclease subunit S [Terriglobales bacterium]
MSEWPRVRLDQCTTIVSGATPDTSESSYWNGDICWATPKDLSELNGAYISNTPRKVTRKGLESCAASVLPPESVLFSSRAPIGHVAINTVPMATNQGFKSFVPKPHHVHSKFLYHWLRKNRPFLESLGNGVTFKEVSRATVSRIEIVLPPITEQRRIAKILDKADALRSQRRAAIAQLDNLTQSVFLDMFGDPIVNPRKLPVARLIDLVDAERPISYGILMPGPNTEGGVPYVRVVDMQDGGIALSGIRRTARAVSDAYRRSSLRAGDLLMSIRGHVGRLAVVPAELDGANITQDTARLAITGANAVFIRECLRSDGFQHWMAKHTKGVAVRGINLGDVKLMPVIVPSKQEQERFAHRVATIAAISKLQRQALVGLDQLFLSAQQ